MNLPANIVSTSIHSVILLEIEATDKSKSFRRLRSSSRHVLPNSKLHLKRRRWISISFYYCTRDRSYVSYHGMRFSFSSFRMSRNVLFFFGGGEGSGRVQYHPKKKKNAKETRPIVKTFSTNVDRPRYLQHASFVCLGNRNYSNGKRKLNDKRPH